MKSYTNYFKVLLLFLAIFISSFSFGQSAEWKDVENFETWPQGWDIYKRNQPGPNISWFKSNTVSLGFAYSGTPTSYIVTGVTNEAQQGDNISQWVYTKPFPVTNGDVISFYTRNLSSTKDRLQVRLATTPSPVVPAGAHAVGDFTILLKEINPNADDSYPSDWTKQTITISGLPQGAVEMATFGFRYYMPNIGCTTCRTNQSGSAVGLTSEEQAIIGEFLNITSQILDFFPPGSPADGLGDLISIGWLAFSLIDGTIGGVGSGPDEGSMVGIDQFEYDPVDIKLQNDEGKYFLHADNPTVAVASLEYDFCANEDVFGQNVQAFTLHNFGPNLQITNATITGTDAADFSFYSFTPTFSVSHTPKKFRIKFNPTTGGTKEAIVNLTTNNPNFPTIKFKIEGKTLNNGTPNLVCWGNVNVKLDANGHASLGNFAFQPVFGLPHPAEFIDLAKYGA